MNNTISDWQWYKAQKFNKIFFFRLINIMFDYE
jgi:hypothetical protein